MRDLGTIRAWLLQPGSGRAARRRLRAIDSGIRGLVLHPCRHPIGEHGFRELHVAGHTILYRLLPDTGADATAGDVEVLRAFGPGQDRGRV